MREPGVTGAREAWAAPFTTPPRNGVSRVSMSRIQGLNTDVTTHLGDGNRGADVPVPRREDPTTLQSNAGRRPEEPRRPFSSKPFTTASLRAEHTPELCPLKMCDSTGWSTFTDCNDHPSVMRVFITPGPPAPLHAPGTHECVSCLHGSAALHIAVTEERPHCSTEWSFGPFSAE